MITGSEAELLDVSHILNAIGLSGIFIIFMIPSMVVVFTAAYLWEKHKQRKRARAEQEARAKQVKDQAEQQAKSQNKCKSNSNEDPLIVPIDKCIIIEDKYKEK